MKDKLKVRMGEMRGSDIYLTVVPEGKIGKKQHLKNS